MTTAGPPVVAPTSSRAPQEPRGTGWLGLDLPTWAGVAAASLVGGWLRLVAIGSHLPQLVEPDEPTTVDRAMRILEGSPAPPVWDWPPGGAAIDAAVLAVGDGLGAPTLTDPGTAYLWSRVAFALLGVLLVPATAVLAGQLSAAGRARRVAAIGAATTVAVSFLLVRFARQVHPDPLQSLFIVFALLAVLRARRTTGPGWWGLAGALAGGAAAMKFIGGLVIIPVVAYAASVPLRWPARARAAGAAVGGAAAAFVAATLGTALTDIRGLIEGIAWQFGMQTAPRLGYEGSEPVVSWFWGDVLPGSLGWPVMLGSVAGLVWLAVRRRTGDGLLVGAAVVLLAFPLLSSVRFPHYALPALPLLAVAATVALGDLSTVRGPAMRATTVGLGVAALAGLWLPLSGDLGLHAAARGIDTREQATTWLAERDASVRVWGEDYALAHTPDVRAVNATRTDWRGCDCLYVVSSYNEDRYRRDPDTYADEVATYDALHATGTVVAAFEPSIPLSYRWNLLPQWGVGALWRGAPVADAPLVTGPRVTILRIDAAG